MSQLRSYAGVGSRETPPAALQEMRDIAIALARAGFNLRSGGAPGADTAFEEGAKSVSGSAMEVFLPWKGFNGNRSPLFHVSAESLAMAATVHPRWELLEQGPRKLHARNMAQALGEALDDPVEAVICWTKDGATHERETNSGTGGTASAIRVASRNGIPVFNLNNSASRRALAVWLGERGIHGLLKLEPPPPEQLGLI